MKNSHRGGFTLVELLIVTVLGALTLGVVYETLIVQEKSFAAARGVMDDQETLRTGLGILESELREVGSIGGDAIGGTDFATIDSDELRFRAQRKLGFICTLHNNEKWALVHSFGDPFVEGDGVLLFVEGNPDTGADDEWDDTVVTSAQEDHDATCLDRWPGVPLQLLKLETQDLTSVTAGSPIRGYEWVTYGLYDFGDLGWGLGRVQGDRRDYLVVGLAPPGRGLELSYYDDTDQPTSDPGQVARIEITLRTAPPGGSGVDPAVVSSTLYLRNN